MAGKMVAAFHALLILSFALTGCISENNKSNYSSAVVAAKFQIISKMVYSPALIMVI